MGYNVKWLELIVYEALHYVSKERWLSGIEIRARSRGRAAICGRQFYAGASPLPHSSH